MHICKWITVSKEEDQFYELTCVFCGGIFGEARPPDDLDLFKVLGDCTPETNCEPVQVEYLTESSEVTIADWATWVEYFRIINEPVQVGQGRY